jgi:uncharacterized membrane protein
LTRDALGRPPGEKGDAPRGPVRSFDDWVRSHADFAALLVVALGFAARLLTARRSFVISDESLHLQLASPTNVFGVYRASLSNAHPPLFVLLLHFWHRIVGPGWQLSLLSVAFGTAFLWVAYRWADSLFGKGPALVTVVLLSFLQPFVILSAEVRGYSLLLLLIAAALAALERGLKKASPSWLVVFAGLTVLASLTHYAALRFAATALVYAGVRLRGERSSRRLVTAYAFGLVAVTGVALLLYATHLSTLRGGMLEREAETTWLRTSYFNAGEVGALAFLARQTASFFLFLFASRAPSIAAAILFAAGIAFLARKRPAAAVLLALPFVIAAAGGLLRLYPYGGSRHSIDLDFFACAGIGVAAGRLAGNRIWFVFALLALLLAPAALSLGW